MKILSFILLFSIPSISSAQIEVKFDFWDGCSNKYINPSFEISNSKHQVIFNSIFDKDSKIFVPHPGIYIIHVFLYDGLDFKTQNTFAVEIERGSLSIDTLYLPKIRYRFEPVLHPTSSYYEYVNCSRPCNGKEICYYPNGIIQLEGEFKQGKPITLREYNEDGNSGRRIQYDVESQLQTLVEYFDDNGEIIEYEIWKYKKGKTLVKSFARNGKLIDSREL